eukprot:m.36728 g.36728  ORF g.36728 m.36728 type:complete len:343 (+) comp5405_c0_seq1:1287-2315(+)
MGEHSCRTRGLHCAVHNLHSAGPLVCLSVGWVQRLCHQGHRHWRQQPAHDAEPGALQFRQPLWLLLRVVGLCPDDGREQHRLHRLVHQPIQHDRLVILWWPRDPDRRPHLRLDLIRWRRCRAAGLVLQRQQCWVCLPWCRRMGGLQFGASEGFHSRHPLCGSLDYPLHRHDRCILQRRWSRRRVFPRRPLCWGQSGVPLQYGHGGCHRNDANPGVQRDDHAPLPRDCVGPVYRERQGHDCEHVDVRYRRLRQRHPGPADGGQLIVDPVPCSGLRAHVYNIPEVLRQWPRRRAGRRSPHDPHLRSCQRRWQLPVRWPRRVFRPVLALRAMILAFFFFLLDACT